MRGDTDADSEDEPAVNESSMAIEASQVPLPTDDDSSDSSSSDESTEDEDEHDEEGTVGDTTANPAATNESSNRFASTTENTAEAVATGGFMIDMEPAIHAILGELQVPEDVDPSFLATLPQEMRDEVISEHLR